jgi:Protein of unknown function (DUF3313)
MNGGMMPQRRTVIAEVVLGCSIPILLLFAGCAQRPAAPAGLKKLPAGAQFAGFLSDYGKLKPSASVENSMVYVKQDEVKNLHKYIAVIVDPVDVYVATNTDLSKMPDNGRAALTAYFQNAMTRAVTDAFPVVEEPGPLVLRLRSALIGVDVGGDANTNSSGDSRAFAHPVDIGKVGVEIELVDSVTGEQIAAAVDRQTLGAGAVVGTASFSKEEKYDAARDAFDGWAMRLRDFLDSAMELSPTDAQRADESYQPYGRPFTKK